MWISHEISPKASPWSSSRRRAPGNPSGRPVSSGRPIRPGFRLVLFLFLVPAVLSAQDGERRAILLQGPNLTRGVPALGANAFEAQHARYELSSGEEVELYLLSVVVSRVEEWEPFGCPPLSASGVALSVREAPLPRVHAYRSENEGRTLLLLGIEDSAPACAFLSAFLEELEFFSSALGESPLLPFPGVLTY